MKNIKLLATILAVALTCAMVVPAFAVDVTLVDGSGQVPVTLNVDAAKFSVTLPTSLPIDVDAKGAVTVSDEIAIVNNSSGAVKVTNMTISGAGDWEIVDWDTTKMKNEKVGTTKVAMTINNEITDGTDSITFDASNFPVMDGANASDSDELPIVYDAKVPAQASAVSNASVANVVFTVTWDA